MTPILIFFSCAWAPATRPSAASAAATLPTRRPILPLDMLHSLKSVCFSCFVGPHHTGGAGRCQDLAALARRQNVEHQVGGRIECLEQNGKPCRVALDL